MTYRWTGGAIGRPVLTPDRAVLGPKRTCFCCVRCRSSICARSISKIIGAKRIVDELKTSHVAEHEYAYKPAKIYLYKCIIILVLSFASFIIYLEKYICILKLKSYSIILFAISYFLLLAFFHLCNHFINICFIDNHFLFLPKLTQVSSETLSQAIKIEK